MIRLLGVLLAATTTPASAQQPGPYKLVVAFDRGGITAIDYPTLDRCERAKRAVQADFLLRLDRSRANAVPGAIVTGAPYHFEAVCIPG